MTEGLVSYNYKCWGWCSACVGAGRASSHFTFFLLFSLRFIIPHPDTYLELNVVRLQAEFFSHSSLFRGAVMLGEANGAGT